MADIEDHLNVTIQQIEKDIKVPCNEFDGKVVYGQKRKNTGSDYKTHTDQMVPIVKQLCTLETQVQVNYLKRHFKIC